MPFFGGSGGKHPRTQGKRQPPSSNIQRSIKIQTSIEIRTGPSVSSWCFHLRYLVSPVTLRLVLGASLELGSWSLDLSHRLLVQIGQHCFGAVVDAQFFK